MSWTPILSYAGSYHLRFEEFFHLAAESGFTEIQVTPDQEPNLYSQISRERRAGLLKLKEGLGLQVHVHNVFYDINLCSLVPDVQSMAFRITESVLQLAVDLEAKTLTVHPGYMFPGWRRDPVQRERFDKGLRASLVQLAILAEKYGMRVLLENGAYHLTTATGTAKTPLHLGITPEDFRDLGSGHSGALGLCLDVNKAMRSGKEAMDFLHACGSLIQQLQVSTARKYADVVMQVIDECQRWIDPVPIVLEDGLAEALDATSVLPGARTLRRDAPARSDKGNTPPA